MLRGHTGRTLMFDIREYQLDPTSRTADHLTDIVLIASDIGSVTASDGDLGITADVVAAEFNQDEALILGLDFHADAAISLA